MGLRKDEPIRMWPGTIVLQCPPCGWGKCVFCGYSKDCFAESQPSTDQFLKQFESYARQYGTEGHLEIYNSGSFLDEKQIISESRIAIFQRLTDAGLKSVTIESRPEFITRETLEELRGEFKGDLTVAIGLEVADDAVLQVLNKGFTLNDIENAHAVIEDMEIGSRAYILVGPPFVEEPRTSALNSVSYAKRLGFTEISLLGAYPMEGSRGYEMWKKGEWVPLGKREFEEIVESARKIEPDIDHASNGLARP